MNFIVISIRPQWVADILNGDKTIEIRKTMPRCKLPAEVYIYATKSTYGYMIGHVMFSNDDLTLDPDTKKYKFGDSCYIMCAKNDYSEDNFLNGKIVAKFMLNKIENIGKKYANQPKGNHFYDVLKASCLTVEDLENYSYVPLEKRKSDFPDLYAWHIEKLEIFDKPKKLSELGLKRAPQSWCYAKETEND